MLRSALFVLPLSGLMAACVGGGGAAPAAVARGTGTPAGDACRAAITAAVNRPAADVIVYRSSPNDQGTLVMATVAGASAPWQCVALPDGGTTGVMYTGGAG